MKFFPNLTNYSTTNLFQSIKAKPASLLNAEKKGHTMPIHACQLVSAMFHVNVHISVCMYSI